MTTSSGGLPRIFATSASVLPVSGLSASDLNSTSRTRSGEPAARYRFSHSVVGVTMACAIFFRVAGSRRRVNAASYPPSSTHGGMAASSPVAPAG